MPVAAEVWPVEVACTNPVYPPLQTMVRDPLKLREGHGRVAEVGDVLELVEVHSVDGRVTFDDGKERLTTAGPGIGCVLTGMRPGEVRSFRVEEQGRTRESIRYEVRGFAGVPPRVRSRRLASGGEPASAPIASGDVVKVLRVIMIDGKRALTNESLEMTAYKEGFGALLLGMRLGDDVVFDVEGLEIKGSWLPAYDPNVRQHIEIELRVDQRVRAAGDVARTQDAQQAQQAQHAQQQDERRKQSDDLGEAACPEGMVSCSGGRKGSHVCRPRAGFTGCPKLP